MNRESDGINLKRERSVKLKSMAIFESTDIHVNFTGNYKWLNLFTFSIRKS